MLVHEFALALQSEPRRPDRARPRPAGSFLMLKEFLIQNPAAAESWDESVEERFREFQVAPEQQSTFAYMSTSLKRMVAAAIVLRIASNIPVPKELQTMHRVSVEECLTWRNVPTAPSKKLLPAIRKGVKEIYGVRLVGSGPEWSWIVPIGPAECITTVTFGGHFCQFAYERHVRFPDSRDTRFAVSWEECIGNIPPQWDQMTGETMPADLDVFFTFAREMEDRIRRFVSSAV
jgi:hypothetical protein